MFWNHGVLHVAEQLKLMSTTVQPDVAFNVLEKTLDYQLCATSYMGTIAKLITNLSSEETTALVDGTDVKLPFVAHHANTELVVSAFQKAVEHTIELNYGRATMAHIISDSHRPTPASVDWMSSLRFFLSCLLSLEETHSGPSAARPAFHALLNSHGDVLMECWTPDE